MDEVDRENYTRVSTILEYFAEPELVAWMIRKGKEANKFKKQAMKIGTDVDESIKNFVVSGSYSKVKTVEAKSCLEAFKRWYDDYKPHLTVGKRLYYDPYQITGEPDLYWGNRIIDIKCASAIRLKYYLQTAAYSFMAGESRSTGILRLHKHLEDYEYVERNDVEVDDDIETFLYLLKVFRYFAKPLLAEKRVEHADSPATETF